MRGQPARRVRRAGTGKPTAETLHGVPSPTQQVQALDRTAPMLPMRPGLPEKQTHDYIRHGTTTLFAALEIATGTVEQRLPTAAPPPGVPARSSSRWPRPTRAGSCIWSWTTTPPTSTPTIRRWLAPQPADHPALHPDLRVVAEPGRDLLLDHHPPGHPPRQLRQRQRPDRRHRHVHRRLERTLPPLRLDQDPPTSSSTTAAPVKEPRLRDTTSPTSSALRRPPWPSPPRPDFKIALARSISVI